MLQRILREIPKLTEAVVARRRQGQAVLRRHHHGRRRRGARGRHGVQGRGAQDDDRRQAQRAPGPQGPGRRPAEGQVKGAVASEGDLAIARYDALTADEIAGRLTGLSQIDLAKVDSYERKNQNRTTVLSRISSLRGDEPWAGYDELTAAEVQAVLAEGDDERAEQVRSYERAHKNRAGVLKAAEREHSNA